MSRNEASRAEEVTVEARPAPYVSAGLLAWCLAPALWIALFGALVVHARIASGEWPHARVGTPMESGYLPATFANGGRLFHGDFLLLLWPFALTSPLWVLADRVVRRGTRRAPRFIQIVLFGLSYVLLLGIVFGDPWSLAAWAFD